jgi:Flp pilus assembly pilin Flp
MKFTIRLYLRAREALIGTDRGQTMTEYALVLLTVFVVLVTSYQVMGRNTFSMVKGITDSVANA